MPKYTRPTTLADALEAMAMPGAHVLVGGTDLLVGLRHHTVEPELIVDLKAVADKLGLEVTPSIANFILIHFPTTPGRTAEEADAFLTKRGLITRRAA